VFGSLAPVGRGSELNLQPILNGFNFNTDRGTDVRSPLGYFTLACGAKLKLGTAAVFVTIVSGRRQVTEPESPRRL
jgi:hypothetical protein